MRILIQQKETGLYFKDVGAWVADAAAAVDFLSSTQAIEFCGANGITGVQLVLKFDDHIYDIVLPVMPDSPHHHHPRRGKTA